MCADGTTLLIDPYFTRVPLWRFLIGRLRPVPARVAEHTRTCDFVLVTHAHFDHLLDVPVVARLTGSRVLGSSNTCVILAACGVRPEMIKQIRVGDRLDLGPFEVEIFAAEHQRVPGFGSGPVAPGLEPPLRAWEYRMDDDFSFLLTVNGRRVLVDSGGISLDMEPVDIAFVQPHLGPDHVASVLKGVQPSVVIINHWDDFFRSLSCPLRPFFTHPGWSSFPLRRLDLSVFRCFVKHTAPKTQVLVPEIFQIYTLDTLLRAEQ